MLSLFIPLAWIRFDAGGVSLTAAMLFAARLELVRSVVRRWLGPAARRTLSRDAPIFLVAEVFAALGYKPGLHERVQRRALELRQLSLAQSADSSNSLPRTSSRSGASGSRSL
jgi:hypothetical protein